MLVNWEECFWSIFSAALVEIGQKLKKKWNSLQQKFKMIGYPFGTVCLETVMWKSATGLQAVWQDLYRHENGRFS